MELSYNELKNLFESTKQNYTALRAFEQARIADEIKKIEVNGKKLFTKTNNMVRHGHKNYSSGKKLFPHYDNSNWKYIEATTEDGVTVHISLQTFDIDPNSRNIHVLFDRIGIYRYEQGKKEADKIEPVSVRDYFYKMTTTKFELPLSDKELRQLAEQIRQIVLS